MYFLGFFLVALFIAIGRFLVPGHDLSWAGTYEALAHIWVGYAMAAWWFDHPPIYDTSRFGWLYSRDGRYLLVLLGLTVLETVMFLIR
jgi:hypothetical protein